MLDDNEVPGSLFFYAPNTAAAAVFTTAYAAVTLVHLFLTWRYKSWSTTALLPFTALAFTAGFAVRIFCSFHYSHANAFIASQFIVYASAPLLELANAHILGRILYYVPYLSPIHPGRVLSSFFVLSTLVEILNGLGVSQSIVGTLVREKTPRSEAYTRQGQAMMKASLILQLCFAILMVGLGAIFQSRCLRRGIRNRKVNMPLLGFYGSMILVTGRTVYRTVEYFAWENSTQGAGQGTAALAPVVRFESYFYVFEATLLFLAIAVFTVLHPRRWLPLHKTTYLAQDGETELEGPGWNDSRHFIVTLCDPFNLAGCLSRTPRQGSGRPFWETNGYQFKTGGYRGDGLSSAEEGGKVHS